MFGLVRKKELIQVKHLLFSASSPFRMTLKALDSESFLHYLTDAVFRAVLTSTGPVYYEWSMDTKNHGALG